MDEIKLKPCPFCGGTKIFVGSVAEIELMDKYDENYDLYNSQFQVVCDSIAGGCGASSGCCKNKAAAIDKEEHMKKAVLISIRPEWRNYNGLT